MAQKQHRGDRWPQHRVIHATQGLDAEHPTRHSDAERRNETKICSNSAAFERMPDDMDLAAGRVLAGLPMEEAADELLEVVIAVASG